MVGFDSDENKMIQLKVEQEEVSPDNPSISNYYEKIQGKLFTCIICGTDFSRKYTLNKHFLKNHNGKSENCEICNKSFFEKHEYEHHLTVCKELDYCEKIQRKLPTCIICGKDFARKFFLNKHFMKNHNGKSEHCEICNKAFFEKHEYEYHLTVCEKLKCECCDASFENLSEIPKHMKDFHGEDRPFKCKICPGSFQGSKI